MGAENRDRAARPKKEGFWNNLISHPCVVACVLVDAEGFVTLVNQSQDANGVLRLLAWQKFHLFA